jgi:hypothetical protein
MERLIRCVKPISFRLRWFFMSPQERYASLWTKTKKLGDLCYVVKNTSGNGSK